MGSEPDNKRAIAYFDAQNLFNVAKACFGYTWPNYDPHLLAHTVCRAKGWNLVQVRFYTGLPGNPSDHRRQFWISKLAALGRRGAFIYQRETRHGQEKGIDIRIALDVVGGALRDEYDVALIFSQDSDFSEVADEIRWIAAQQGRWIKIASAFPDGTGILHASQCRGIPRTDWVPLDKATYDACIDHADYRPRSGQ